MKLSKLALSDNRLKWPVLIFTVAAFAFFTYWFIGYAVHLFWDAF